MMDKRARLESEINALPKGTVSAKHIKGKEYLYHRWYEDGVRKEQYVSETEAVYLSEQIAKRKELEAELKKLGPSRRQGRDRYDFSSSVIVGDGLASFSEPVRKLKKRECFRQLHDYIYGDNDGKVLVLFGLRRTGKTTLIRQLIAEMDDSTIARTAFMQIMPSNTLADINKDLIHLFHDGYRYVFIDEVTMLSDFIEGGALFADLFASSGMKIILSGTDSLGFVFAEDEQLYDRMIMVHTTFIPYREFVSVLGISGVDEYIRFGGTMSLSGINYNEGSPFAASSSAGEYVDTAIARNIQHSLRNYQDGRHFRLLLELYEKNELTSAINRVVEDMNHRFTLEVLTRDFRSNDLSLSARNLRKDRDSPTTILDDVDVVAVTERLRRRLEIRNQEEMAVSLSTEHAAEIKEYLRLLDLIHEIPIALMDSSTQRLSRTAVSQPGLRYSQADALVSSLLEDEMMDNLPAAERSRILERIRNEIKGRMLEDIVLLETTFALPGRKVFSLQFDVGEFDMVVQDPEAITCQIYEIKHSDKIDERQCRQLLDSRKCEAAEFRYGRITGKYVLYRGEDADINGIHYINVEEYLMHLKDS